MTGGLAGGELAKSLIFSCSHSGMFFRNHHPLAGEDLKEVDDVRQPDTTVAIGIVLQTLSHDRFVQLLLGVPFGGCCG